MADKIFVVSGTIEQYRVWRTNHVERVEKEHNTTPRLSNIVYVVGPESFRGIREPKGVFIGTWYHRFDIEQVIFQLQIQGSLQDNQQVSKLLAIVDRNR